MERPSAELCRFACQHGQIDHEKVQKRAVPQVRENQIDLTFNRNTCSDLNIFHNQSDHIGSTIKLRHLLKLKF